MNVVRVLALVLSIAIDDAAADVFVYQPTPFPKLKSNGKPMSQDFEVLHFWEYARSVCITPVCTDVSRLNTSFVKDTYVVGGISSHGLDFWIRFNLGGLPFAVDKASFELYRLPLGVHASKVRFAPVPGDANEKEWPVEARKKRYAPFGRSGKPGGFDTLAGNFTTLYNDWKEGRYDFEPRIFFEPDDNDASCRNCVTYYASGHNRNAAQRPRLVLAFTPTLRLKMPLPSGNLWQLSNEIGGYECMGLDPWPDEYHQDAKNGYFALDFTWKSKPIGGQASAYHASNVPILAAAGGVVVTAQYNKYNGNYVVIDHDGDGNLETGYQTWYLHMQDTLAVKSGQKVAQGDKLGFMGTTGISTGTHLHFLVRYKNKSLSTIPELAKVVMEDLMLKSYQTECSVDSKGRPTGWVNYYPAH